MEKSNRIEAIHPHWNGFLRLSSVNNAVFHEGHGSKGIYNLRDGTLTVFWDKYKPDVFLELSGLYVHESLLKDASKIEEIPRFENLFAAVIDNQPVILKRISVSVPGRNYEVSLRLKTSDIQTFSQVFIRREYESQNLPESANSIVDLGANIGLATVFFGLKYPEAKILSVEPEENNFESMVINTASLGDRVQKRLAAVWINDGVINIHTENENGAALDAWGVQVSDRKNETNTVVKCNKLGTLLRDAEFGSVDILKIDIEGAELEVFSNEFADWLPKISLIIVETHDRFRPGSEEAVRKAIHPMFEELPRSGENLFFRRVPT